MHVVSVASTSEAQEWRALINFHTKKNKTRLRSTFVAVLQMANKMNHRRELISLLRHFVISCSWLMWNSIFRTPFNVCDTVKELFHQNETLHWRLSAAGCHSRTQSCSFIGRRWVWWHLNLNHCAGIGINSRFSVKISDLKYHNLWQHGSISLKCNRFRISRRSIREIKTNFDNHVSLWDRKRIFNNQMYQFRSDDWTD